MNKNKNKNDKEWVWAGAFFLFIVLVIVIAYSYAGSGYPNNSGNSNNNYYNNNNRNRNRNRFNNGNSNSLKNNRNRNRNSNYSSQKSPEDPWGNSKKPYSSKGKDDEGSVAIVLIIVFLVIGLIIWGLASSIQSENRRANPKYYPPKKKDDNDKPHMKWIVMWLVIGFFASCGMTAYNTYFIWGIIVSFVTLCIALSYWFSDDCYGYTQYSGGQSISLNKNKKFDIKVKNQGFRLQIFLNGAWENTAWGGNDEKVVIARAKDMSENNDWNITKVRVRKGKWKGEIIKEFAKKKFLKSVKSITPVKSVKKKKTSQV